MIASEITHIQSTIRALIYVKGLSMFQNPMNVHLEVYRMGEDCANVLTSGKLLDVSWITAPVYISQKSAWLSYTGRVGYALGYQNLTDFFLKS